MIETSAEELAGFFGARLDASAESVRAPSYNVAPTATVLGVAADGDDARVLRSYRWGLVPSWAKDPSAGNRMFNARAETIATKPSFRAAFASRRIVVVADGYWEWRKGPGKLRQPYYLHSADGKPLAFAGLAESWRDSRPDLDDGPSIRSCTIVTTTASDELAAIHDRMPVVLREGALDVWLDPTSRDRETLENLLCPAPAATLHCYPVDRRVGDVRNNDRGLLARIALDEEPSV